MAIKSSKFGRQPICEVIWRAGYSHTEFAEMTGIRPVSHVRTAITGVAPPSPEFRRAAVQVLNRPIEELFTAEALAAIFHPYQRRMGPSPRRRQNAQAE